MTWGALPVFVSGAALTAPQMNLLAGDLNETAPAKATAAGQIFVSTAANAIAARVPTGSTVNTAESTSSISTYGNLATIGPTVIVTTGTTAIVFYGCMANNNTGGGGALMSYEYVKSDATVVPAPNGYPLRIGTESFSSSGSVYSGCRVHLQAALLAGSTTFYSKYTTPTGGTATFQDRELLVIPL